VHPTPLPPAPAPPASCAFDLNDVTHEAYANFCANKARSGKCGQLSAEVARLCLKSCGLCPPPPSPPRSPAPPPLYELFTGWPFYRLGDMFLRPEWRGTSQCHPEGKSEAELRRDCHNALYHCAKWPRSLACRYTQATGSTGDYRVLAGLVRAYDASVVPPGDALVVHLRLGDVFEEDSVWGAQAAAHPWAVDAEMRGELPAWQQAALERYIFSLSHYQKHLRGVPAHVRSAVLVGGAHHQIAAYPRSSAYLNALRDFFVSKGFDVQLRLARAPDEDVVFMGRSRHFMQGGGGFSVVVAGVVKELGGEIH